METGKQRQTGRQRPTEEDRDNRDRRTDRDRRGWRVERRLARAQRWHLRRPGRRHAFSVASSALPEAPSTGLAGMSPADGRPSRMARRLRRPRLRRRCWSPARSRGAGMPRPSSAEESPRRAGQERRRGSVAPPLRRSARSAPCPTTTWQPLRVRHQSHEARPKPRASAP